MRERVIKVFPGPGKTPEPVFDGVAWLDPPAAARGDRDMTPAAVLVPLIDRAGGMTVLLTQRTEHLNAHAGQISFPGGRTEDGDDTPEETALRETEEEIGLPRAHVELVGRMNVRETGTGYRVVPVVGLIEPPFPLAADPSEVAEIFEMPLDFAIDPANHRLESRIVRGVERRFYVLPYRGYYIWGLTARLLVNLSELLRS